MTEKELKNDTVENTGLVEDVVKSIMTPGYTANGVIKIMFYTFYALFITLLFMIYLTRGNPHVIALFLLALCLFVTIKWFIAELDRSKHQENTGKKNK
ncbi:MAG: ER protein Pkr1-domain-containing protein [Benjaminiella poitrasii]|nr:MAG: ER protein Pkr1-domain-containing protein [Benjaminiella poitrasii]